MVTPGRWKSYGVSRVPVIGQAPAQSSMPRWRAPPSRTMRSGGERCAWTYRLSWSHYLTAWNGSPRSGAPALRWPRPTMRHGGRHSPARPRWNTGCAAGWRRSSRSGTRPRSNFPSRPREASGCSTRSVWPQRRTPRGARTTRRAPASIWHWPICRSAAPARTPGSGWRTARAALLAARCAAPAGDAVREMEVGTSRLDSSLSPVLLAHVTRRPGAGTGESAGG